MLRIYLYPDEMPPAAPSGPSSTLVTRGDPCLPQDNQGKHQTIPPLQTGLSGFRCFPIDIAASSNIFLQKM